MNKNGKGKNGFTHAGLCVRRGVAHMTDTMRQYNTFILMLFAGLMSTCNANTQWKNISYDSNIVCSEIMTHCELDSEIFQKAHIYIEQDTMFICFYALPSDWNMTIKVYDGKFCAFACEIPFAPVEVTYTTLEQRLQLAKKHYTLGDTLCGYCNIHFQFVETPMIDSDEKSAKGIISFSGSIRETVRTKDFNPFDKENFMTFELPTALLELGEPSTREQFNTLALPEFRIELLNYLPASKDVWIEELTWDVSPTSGISDEGRERLTIWYAQKNNKWLPVHYLQWNTNMQF